MAKKDNPEMHVIHPVERIFAEYLTGLRRVFRTPMIKDAFRLSRDSGKKVRRELERKDKRNV